MVFFALYNFFSFWYKQKKEYIYFIYVGYKIKTLYFFLYILHNNIKTLDIYDLISIILYIYIMIDDTFNNKPLYNKP